MQTDRAVARLPERLRKALKVYYLTHASSEIKAASLCVSRATFWRLVERGQQSVFDYLNAETETPYSQASLQVISF
jgi:hypothetical protein